jgi:O-antigen ligase
MTVAGDIKSGIPGVNLTTAIIYTALILSIFKKDIKLPLMGYAIISFSLIAILSAIAVSLSSVQIDRGLVPALVEAKRTLDYFFLYLIFLFAIKNEKGIRSCLLFIILGISLEAGWAFKQYLFGSYRRLYGTLAENELGAFICCYLFVPLFYLLEAARAPIRRGLQNVKALLLSGACVVLSMVALLFSLSRGAMVAFAAGLPIFGLFRSKKAFAVIIVLLCVTAVFYQTVLPEKVTDRIQSTFEQGAEGEVELDQSAQSRLEFLRAALKLFFENPLLGVGYGNFGIRTMETFGRTRATHNEFARILVETGLLGFLPFVSIFILASWHGLKLWKTASDSFYRGFAAAYMACIVSVVAVNMTGNRFENGIVSAYFWVLSALTHRAYLFAKEK